MSTNTYQIIAVDFDGTLCFSNWPELGKPNLPLIRYLIAQKRAGNRKSPSKSSDISTKMQAYRKMQELRKQTAAYTISESERAATLDETQPSWML